MNKNTIFQIFKGFAGNADELIRQLANITWKAYIRRATWKMDLEKEMWSVGFRYTAGESYGEGSTTQAGLR